VDPEKLLDPLSASETRQLVVAFES